MLFPMQIHTFDQHRHQVTHMKTGEKKVALLAVAVVVIRDNIAFLRRDSTSQTGNNLVFCCAINRGIWVVKKVLLRLDCFPVLRFTQRKVQHEIFFKH